MPQPEVTEPVRRQFDAVAAAYAVSPVHQAGPDLEALVREAALTGTEEALDLGCGAGHAALRIAPLVRRVVAFDLTQEMLDVAASLAEAKGLANLEFRRGDVTELPFADGSFDIVTSRYSAHHYPDPARAVREAARVLRPGGRFLLVDTVAPEDPALDTFCNAFEITRDHSHVRNARVSEWAGFFEAAGLATTVPFQMDLNTDADAWVARAQTPPDRVAGLRALFAAATPAAKARFSITLDPWAFAIPVALVAGRKS